MTEEEYSVANPGYFESNSGPTHVYIGKRKVESRYGRSRERKAYLCGTPKASSHDRRPISGLSDADVCGNCHRSAKKRGLLPSQRFEDGSTPDVDMIPEVERVAIRDEGNTWKIYEDGQLVGNFTGSEDMVRELVGDED